jgi:mono/diheme cytochrome c family protein
MRKMWRLVAAVAWTGMLIGHVQAAADAAAVYQKCMGCHKSTGLGTPGVFPPLAGHAAQLVSTDRAYPIQAVLFGLKGKILVQGKTYNGTMPAYIDRFNDDEIAAALNYILSGWGNDKMLPKGYREISAAEVHALRGKHLTQEQVYEARQKLKLP